MYFSILWLFFSMQHAKSNAEKSTCDFGKGIKLGTRGSYSGKNRNRLYLCEILIPVSTS